MSTRQDPYLIYVEKYANFLIGVELNVGGCGEKKAKGSAKYDERGQKMSSQNCGNPFLTSPKLQMVWKISEGSRDLYY